LAILAAEPLRSLHGMFFHFSRAGNSISHMQIASEDRAFCPAGDVTVTPRWQSLKKA